MPLNRVIVIGASAGGVGALCSLVQELPPDLPAAVFVVQHVGAVSMLPEILRRCHGHGHVTAADDGEAIQPGHIYLAPPNHHLMINDGHVHLSKGPRENLHRPSVDVLFRSAARNYGPQVIGVVLTGTLDDGASGVFSIKAKGGVAVVQDPREAPFPDMPANALRAGPADYCLPLARIAPLLTQLARKRPAARAFRRRNGVAPPSRGKAPAPVRQAGQPVFICPECDGPLTQHRHGPFVSFECQVGHRFSLDSLSEAHAQALERAIWETVRTLEQRVAMHQALAERYRREHQAERGKNFQESAAQAARDARLLREIAEHI